MFLVFYDKGSGSKGPKESSLASASRNQLNKQVVVREEMDFYSVLLCQEREG